MGKTKKRIAIARERREAEAHVRSLITSIKFWPNFRETLDRTTGSRQGMVTWGRAWVIDGLYRLGELELARKIALWAICLHDGSAIQLSWLQDAVEGRFISKWYLREDLTDEEREACLTNGQYYLREQVVRRHDEVFAWVERERRVPTYKEHPLCRS